MEGRSFTAWFNRVRALDPAPGPGVPKPSFAFMVCLLGLVFLTVWLLVTNRYLPGTDTPYHAFCSRVWIDAGKAGTPYAGYEPRHLLEANTLLYDVAGIFSIVMRPFTAYRITCAWYFLGLPLACLYALRAFGRSPWGSLLAFPLCYNESFASGYMCFNFAAPTFVLAIVEYVRFTSRPTVRRGALVAVLFILVFLSHAHVYLWLGALVGVITVIAFAKRLGALAPLDAGRLVLVCTAVGLPSLLMFRAWYTRGYGQGHAVGGTAEVKLSDSMSSLPLAQKFTGGILQTFTGSLHPYEVHFVIALGVIVVLAMGLARAQGDRVSTAPEIALVLTAVSYFVLPDSVAGQMVAARQWYMVAWLLPLVVAPVLFRIAPGRALTVVLAIAVWTGTRMWVVSDYLHKYSTTEMVGLDHLARTAPREPGLTIAYAGVDAASENWRTSHGHSYGFVAAERDYEGPLEPSDKNAIAAVRYTSGPPLPIKHIYNNPMWYVDPEIWRYDLVLVRRWKPTHEQKSAAAAQADLVAAGGDWELWRRHK